MSEPSATSAAVEARTDDHLSPGVPRAGRREQPRSLGRDAWEDLRRKPIFWISLVLMTIFVLMALFPGLFTNKDPYFCDLANSRQPPSSEAWFGYDAQGCDVYARTIYGARASIAVGFTASLVALIVGAGIGVIAGFYGGWRDNVLSRVTDIFFAIPILLGSIIVLSAFPTSDDPKQWQDIAKVSLAIAFLGWTATARISRSSVIQVRSADFVQAARSLGASNGRIIRRHVLPNAAAPIIVITTISLGGYIGAEATLSFLGIGLQPPTVSWGIAINDAQAYLRTSPYLLFFPATFLSLAVLSFIMLGDSVREALDPKLR